MLKDILSVIVFKHLVYREAVLLAGCFKIIKNYVSVAQLAE